MLHSPAGLPEPPAPPNPLATYLQLLADGHSASYALTHAGFNPDDETEVYAASIVSRARRANPEFAALESMYADRTLTGARPAMARAAFEHNTLKAAFRLSSEMDHPGESAADSQARTAAAVQSLAHSSLAPKAQGVGVQVQVQVLVGGLSYRERLAQATVLPVLPSVASDA